MPKVSFVIPVFDGDSYLAETLETIRNQTMKDIEIIVIDDCSPDFTPELMDYYLKLDDRIKYHRFEENKGVQEARNFGNKIATAEIICVCDQDDLCKHWRAAFSYYYLQNHPEVDCITSSYWECTVDGVPVEPYKDLPDMTREEFEKGDAPWMHSTAAYRRKDILELPYREDEDTKLPNRLPPTDDLIFLDDWTKAGKKFKTVRPVLCNQRRTPWSVMQQRRTALGKKPSFIL